MITKMQLTLIIIIIMEFDLKIGKMCLEKKYNRHGIATNIFLLYIW